MALTVRKVERESKPGRYGDGHGLYLQITRTGGKSYVLRYERGGKECMMGLGPAHAFTLDEARERARLARQKLADGVDPLADSKAERAARALKAAKQLTFKEAAIQYFEQHKGKWKNSKHTAQFLSTLETYAFPVFGEISVKEVDVGLVLQALEPIWVSKTETATRVRSRVENVLAWATVRGYRTGDNPARWTGHLREVLPAPGAVAKVRHHPALPYLELPTFIASLRKREGISARALELTVLTAARTGEITGAKWSEFDLDAGLWVAPPERMKGTRQNARQHRVPLSERAVALLRALPREGEFVFPGTQKNTFISNMSMAAVLKRMEIKPERATVHGFRSSFRDWCSERTAFPHEVVEMALAHTIKSAVEAAYRRGDLLEKRRPLMEAWAKYCESGVAAGGKVVSLRGARA